MKQFTILIPHYKSGQITAYSVSQFLKYTDAAKVDIIVIDNSVPHDSIKYLEPFKGQIKILPFKSIQISSHGVAYDYAMQFVETPYIITSESDSFPTEGNWIDYYDNLIDQEYDMAGSLLQLSGGAYIHPAGALYKKENWDEAKKYCDESRYAYFPNMAKKNDFDCHLMVRKDFINEFLENPEPHIVLAEGYKPYSQGKALDRLVFYKPVVGPFHNGMGRLQESIHTYGMRNMATGGEDALLDNRANLIYRIGLEPGQFFSYWHLATDKMIFNIPTQTKWLPNREGQQQEYTINEAGFKHLWCGSAYLGMKDTDFNDVYEFKKNQTEELYNSLPDHQKITAQ